MGTNGSRPDPSTLTDLANARVGGKVIFATDEWFAAADNLIEDDEPKFDPDAYTTYGKEMDGWESRRKRIAGHDWAIFELGLAGEIEAVEVDTAFFTGNQAPRLSIQAAELAPGTTGALLALRLRGAEGRGDDGRMGLAATAEELAAAEALGSAAWSEVLPMTELGPGYEETRRHMFQLPAATGRVTHIRVNMFPDGGIARLRCLGRVSRRWTEADFAPGAPAVDLLAVENGGTAIGCSNQHYGHPKNIIRPGRGVHMGDGWETARKPGRPAVLKVGADGLVEAPGSDWSILKLGAPGVISEIVVDTNHFKGNFPESAEIVGCYAPTVGLSAFDDGGSRLPWRPVLPRTKLSSSSEHRFQVGDEDPVTHLKVTIFPDGGIMRLRAIGKPVRPKLPSRL